MKKVLVLFAFVCLAGWAPASADNLLVNANFETPAAIPTWPPTVTGLWSGDIAEMVDGRDGITPFEGSGMVKFNYTGVNPHAEVLVSCEVWQLVDLSAYHDLISAGQAIAQASCRVNRVAGDAETDTRFDLVLYAQAGDPADFDSIVRDELVLVRAFLFSDADLGTWEQVSFEASLPAATDYVAIKISATENVFNDTSGLVEFDGHYADAVSLTIVPEPATLALLVVGGIGLLRRTSRRGRRGGRPTHAQERGLGG